MIESSQHAENGRALSVMVEGLHEKLLLLEDLIREVELSDWQAQRINAVLFGLGCEVAHLRTYAAYGPALIDGSP